jgi:hypothetical protein
MFTTNPTQTGWRISTNAVIDVGLNKQFNLMPDLGANRAGNVQLDLYQTTGSSPPIPRRFDYDLALPAGVQEVSKVEVQRWRVA